MSAQPLFTSSGTHLLLHFLVPDPQVPTPHVDPVQTKVPEPGSGQDVASQLVAPQPKLGSLTATHLPLHFLVPDPQSPMTHAPL
jgi:hypothetical protein